MYQGRMWSVDSAALMTICSWQFHSLLFVLMNMNVTNCTYSSRSSSPSSWNTPTKFWERRCSRCWWRPPSTDTLWRGRTKKKLCPPLKGNDFNQQIINAIFSFFFLLFFFVYPLFVIRYPLSVIIHRNVFQLLVESLHTVTFSININLIFFLIFFFNFL